MVEGDHLVEINKKMQFAGKRTVISEKVYKKSNTVKPKKGEKLEFWK